MKIHNVLSYLEQIAPPKYQADYDNAGLLVGDRQKKVTGVLLCLDSTEEVLDEAIKLKCNLVIAHHPIIFKGIKRLNGSNYIERVLIKAIKNDIAIYAIHTNLDSVYYQGVNSKIAEKLELKETRILAPQKAMKKLYTFVGVEHSDLLKSKLFEAGAGYTGSKKNISYSSLGVGTSQEGTNAQIKLEVIYPLAAEASILNTLHTVLPKESLEYDIISLENNSELIGAGMIGQLKKSMKEEAFLKKLKTVMNTDCIRYTKLRNKEIKTVALCGGAGGFLLTHAIRQGADIFITADYKYHEFFDANDRIIITDIGHYESEQFTIELLQEILSQKFSNFAAHCTKVNTNPVNYLF